MIESQPASPGHVFCPRCRGKIDTADAFCRHCGRRLREASPWYYEIHWIVILALVVLGPLTIPLVVRSPKLSGRMKIVLSAAIIAYTGFLVYEIYAIYMVVWEQYTEILNG